MHQDKPQDFGVEPESLAAVPDCLQRICDDFSVFKSLTLFQFFLKLQNLPPSKCTSAVLHLRIPGTHLLTVS